MAAEVANSAPGEAVSMLLMPHRSLSRTGLAMFLVAQSFAAFTLAALAAWQGNVLAPPFAVIELGVLAFCLRRVWLASGCGQVITLTASRLDVTTTSGVACSRFHPYWVRVRLIPGSRRAAPSRLLLGSHGRDVEIGAFLNETERRLMAQRLAELLRPLQAGGRPSEISIQGDSK